MHADVLSTRVADGIAVITLGSARRIYFDEEMGDALTEALDGFAGDARLVRNATETPLAQGLALERNLFLRLCTADLALARMRSYEEENITSPSRSIEWTHK